MKFKISMNSFCIVVKVFYKVRILFVLCIYIKWINIVKMNKGIWIKILIKYFIFFIFFMFIFGWDLFFLL